MPTNLFTETFVQDCIAISKALKQPKLHRNKGMSNFNVNPSDASPMQPYSAMNISDASPKSKTVNRAKFTSVIDK